MAQGNHSSHHISRAGSPQGQSMVDAGWPDTHTLHHISTESARKAANTPAGRRSLAHRPDHPAGVTSAPSGGAPGAAPSGLGVGAADAGDVRAGCFTAIGAGLPSSPLGPGRRPPVPEAT